MMNVMNNTTPKQTALHNTRDERIVLYRSLVGLAIPIIIQNLISALVNSMDVLMLGYVGQNELSAVSLANQYAFLLTGFYFGIASGTTLMCSQYWGKHDTQSIQAVMGIALKISVVFSTLVGLAAILFAPALMTLFTNDTVLVEIGARYLRFIGISYIFTGFSQVYHCTIRSVERAKLSTAIGTITLFVNVSLNACFIFGLLFFPRLGVVGVAIATVIARAVEVAICLGDYLRGRVFKPDLKVLFGNHPELLSDFIKYSVPALFNDLSWTIAFSTYSIILGHMNTDMVAASSVATTIRDLFTTVCFGLSAAGTVIIGKTLGASQFEKAKKDAATLCHVTLISTAILGLIMVLLRHPLMSLFTLTDRAQNYLNLMLLISGYYIVGQAINTLLIAGIFRAGGDTKFGMICDTVTMWVIAVPLGFISAFALNLPPMVVYFILCLDEFWKIPVVYKHYKKYNWVRNITREET